MNGKASLPEVEGFTVEQVPGRRDDPRPPGRHRDAHHGGGAD
jgi:hypothetical protein